MHNNMHITQSLYPQSFLANSVPGSVTREYHPKIRGRSQLLQRIF